MTATLGYPATMPELRGDPAPPNLWPNYGGQVHMSPRMESGLPQHHTSPHAAVRPKIEPPSMDHQAYPYDRYPPGDAEAYNGQAASGLQSQPAYPNTLKRPYSQTDTTTSPEMVQAVQNDGSGMTVNQDHKLLAFRKAQDKLTITDQHGRLQQLEMAAQLHGMFFLSEMPSNGNEAATLQPELTCYRRNLFQISGSLVRPRGQLNAVIDTGESVLITNMDVAISAIESVDGNPVRLIVIPWKTPPPNSPEVNQAPDQEPPSVPLIPFQEDGIEPEGELTVYPIGWRRLQFRIATANNGRRKELQQHFVLHLKVYGTLANGSKVALTESVTAPIVVRGRSPRNFQARKEIPLLGSSAGSRGQALVENGLGVVAGTLSMKQQEDKSRGSVDMQMPRSAFTFSAPKPPGGQMTPMRSNTYPAWTPNASIGPPPQVPGSGSQGYPASSIGGDLYSKVHMSGTNFSAEPHEMPLQTTMPPSVPLSLIAEEGQQPLRSQYTYVPSSTASRQMSMNAPGQGGDVSSNVPRYVDDGRAAKTARSSSGQPVSSTDSINSGTPPDYRYGSYGSVNSGGAEGLPATYGSETSVPSTTGQREVYPPPHNWRPTEHNSNVPYGTTDHRSSFNSAYDQYKPSPGDSQVKREPGQPDAYGVGHRGSSEAMNYPSWNNS